MDSIEESDKGKVTEIMESKGYTGNIWDMEQFSFPFNYGCV